MLSQVHTMDFIQFWLTQWLRDNPKSHEIVMDESEALMGAAVRAFTQYESTNDYLVYGIITE